MSEPLDKMEQFQIIMGLIQKLIFANKLPVVFICLDAGEGNDTGLAIHAIISMDDAKKILRLAAEDSNVLADKSKFDIL